MKRFAILLIAVMFLSFSTVSATKIQKNDTWKYKDKNNIEYNETAIEEDDFEGGDTMIATILLNTSRPFYFDLNRNGINFSFVSILEYQNIVVTQEGGIPMFPYNSVLTYNATFLYDSTMIVLSDTTSVNWGHNKDDPSLALVTTSSAGYWIGMTFGESHIATLENSTTPYVVITKKFSINSNSEFTDKTKNFTMTEQKYEFYFYYRDYEYSYIVGDGGLHLNDFERTAMKLTYEEGINQPTYIAQTEPTKTIYGLSLSQSSELVEYFLVRDEETNTNETPINFVFFVNFILLILLKKRRKN
jgi:hypothetical protein